MRIRNGIDIEELAGFTDVLATTPEAAAATVRVRDHWEGGYAMGGSADGFTVGDDELTRAHTVQLDMPKEFGGGDAGPTPGELLLAALAACVAQQFVERAATRGVEIGELNVTCEAQVDLRGTFGVADVRPGMQSVDLRIQTSADADDGVLHDLLAYAVSRSPIADSVANPVTVRPTVERWS